MHNLEQSNSENILSLKDQTGFLKKWFMAVRPKTLLAGAGPVFLGLLLAYGDKTFSPILAIITLVTTLLLQAGANLVNDYFDFKSGVDKERQFGPLRLSQTGLIAPHKIRNAFVALFIIAFLLGLFLIYKAGLPILILGLLSLAAAYLYTGGPFPLSHMALGEVIAFIFFGPVAVWGTYFIQTSSHSQMALIAGFAPGFAASALMALNNFRDREDDKKTKKVTLAIILGPYFARMLPVLFIIFSSFVPFRFYQEGTHPWATLGALPFFIFLSKWFELVRTPADQRLNPFLGVIGLYQLILCLTMGIAYQF